MTRTWPTADLDPVRRLQVMSAAVTAPMYVEELVDAPYDRVWAVASDLESELPGLVRAMREFTVLEQRADGEFTARARSVIGHRATFDVVLRPGWCLMQSPYVIAGMAAVPAGDRTRFAVLGAGRAVRGRAAQRVLGPLGRELGRSMLRRLRTRVE